MPSFVQEAIKEFASPIIFKLLKPYNSLQLDQAVETDFDLLTALREQENIEYYNRLKTIVAAIPFSSKVGEYLKNRKWIDYFIDNELKHKRPDLYAVFEYKPNARKWLYKQIKNLAKEFFGV